MRTRIAALVVACLAGSLMVTVTATAQTSTSTTTATTTTTVFANPCAGRICTPQPPLAFVSGVGGDVRLDPGSSCWSGIPDAQGNTTAFCADAPPRDPDAILVVQAGETLTLRFGAMTPTEVLLRRGILIDTSQPPITLPATNPTQFKADFPVGVQVFSVFTRWLQGDAAYRVRLDVRAEAPPATPRPGTVSLTG